MSENKIELERELVVKRVNKELQNKKEWFKNYILRKIKEEFQFSPYDIDQYYPLLKHCTMPTKFISINDEIIESLINFYRFRYLNVLPKNCSKLIIQNDIENILKLYNILDENIKTCNKIWYGNQDANNGVFIRCSRRSPKDGYHGSFKSKTSISYGYNKLFDELINNPLISNKKLNGNEANISIICLNKLNHSNTVITNANDALSLILTSERLFLDFRAKQMVNNFLSNNNSIKIAFRKWDKNIKFENEFRCFVFNNKLTAISQSSRECYFEYLQDAKMRSNIKRLIVGFWKEHMAKQMSNNCIYSNYVFDICVDYKNAKCIVIELNPFCKKTGPGMFGWKGKDLMIVKGIKKNYNNINTPFGYREQPNIRDICAKYRVLHYFEFEQQESWKYFLWNDLLIEHKIHPPIYKLLSSVYDKQIINNYKNTLNIIKAIDDKCNDKGNQNFMQLFCCSEL
eukprot:8102_1